MCKMCKIIYVFQIWISKFYQHVKNSHVNLMFLYGKALRHVIDSVTRFSSAAFLDAYESNYRQSTEGVRIALMECWCTMYIGHPNRIPSDPGSVFTSEKWKKLSESTGIGIGLSGNRAHSFLRIGEKLLEPSCRILNTDEMYLPSVIDYTLLKIALKAMNDTIGENWFVPSLFFL